MERRQVKRGGLLSSDIVIKESPQPAGPAHSHTHCRLAPRHTLVHTYRCLHAGRTNAPLREMRGVGDTEDDNAEVLLWRVSGKTDREEEVKPVVSGRWRRHVEETDCCLFFLLFYDFLTQR